MKVRKLSGLVLMSSVLALSACGNASQSKSSQTTAQTENVPKEATALAKDNLTWLKIEIYRKDGHNFNELEELYNRYDHNERDHEVFRLLELEKKAPAIEEVEALADGYQDSLNAYTDQIEALEALIEEHASDSMENELLELVAKYYAIANTQKEDVNNYLAGFDIKDLIR